jgi:hypothetical protein
MSNQMPDRMPDQKQVRMPIEMSDRMLDFMSPYQSDRMAEFRIARWGFTLRQYLLLVPAFRLRDFLQKPAFTLG